jgi:hypothetical protein
MAEVKTKEAIAKYKPRISFDLFLFCASFFGHKACNDFYLEMAYFVLTSAIEKP